MSKIRRNGSLKASYTEVLLQRRRDTYGWGGWFCTRRHGLVLPWRHVSTNRCTMEQLANVTGLVRRIHESVRAVRAEVAEDMNWVKTPAASEALRQPPFPSKPPGISGVHSSLDAYLEARNWPWTKGPCRRFLSHILTYPLTLAAGLTQANLTGVTPSSSQMIPRRLSVSCVGARAEGSLPLALWRETLFALPRDVEHVDVHMVGPELALPSCADARRISLKWRVAHGGGGDNNEKTTPQKVGPRPCATVLLNGRTLTVTWNQSMLREEEILARGMFGDAIGELSTDAYVLFNPGLGHPALKEGWGLTLDYLLRSGRPLVVTSHSEGDMVSDVGRLQESVQGKRGVHMRNEEGAGAGSKGLTWLCEPEINIFRSLRKVEDPLDLGSGVVTANWGMFCVAGTPGTG
ncbi:unnamed protein product [Choristocarpus tenellus]